MRNLIAVSFSMAMFLCLSVTMLGSDSFIDSTTDIVCVADYDYAPSVDIVANTVPAPSDVVFVASAESPTIDMDAEVPSDLPDLNTTALTYGKPMIRKGNHKRKKSKTKRKRNRSRNKSAFPGQSRSGTPFKGCAWSN